MTKLERTLLALLQELKSQYGAVAVKVDFEAEGSRIEEAIRLKDLALRAGLELIVKVGGCEALRDMHDARLLGADRVVGPMIESAYALRKFVNACKQAWDNDERNHVKFLINLETRLGLDNFEAMLQTPELASIHGVVMGRVDFVGSLERSRTEIDDQEVQDACRLLSKKCKNAGLEFSIGGGISPHSLDFFRTFSNEELVRYETRKFVFDTAESLKSSLASEGLRKAAEFEIGWLDFKHEFYGRIANEDENRRKMMKNRLRSLENKT